MGIAGRVIPLIVWIRILRILGLWRLMVLTIGSISARFKMSIRPCVVVAEL